MGNKNISSGFISNKKVMGKKKPSLCVSKMLQEQYQLTLPLVLEDSNVISEKGCLFWERHSATHRY